MANVDLPWQEVTVMIQRWLSTPESGYLGSSGGGKTIVAQVTAELPTPTGIALILNKLREDLPYFADRSPKITWAHDQANSVDLTVTVGADTETFSI